jgi:hypothetical protein
LLQELSKNCNNRTEETQHEEQVNEDEIETEEVSHFEDESGENSESNGEETHDNVVEESSKKSLNEKLKNQKLKIKIGILNNPRAGKVVKKKFSNEKRLYIKHDKLDHLFKDGSLELLTNNQKNVAQIMKENEWHSLSKQNSSIKAKKIPLKLSNILFQTSFSSKIKSSENNQIVSNDQNHITNDDITNFVNKYLIKTSSSSSDLNRENSSSNYLKYLHKCKTCNIMFLDKRMLREHQIFCESSYATKANNKILVHEHPEPQSSLTDFLDKHLSFKCSFCNEVYPSKSLFVYHSSMCASL